MPLSTLHMRIHALPHRYTTVYIHVHLQDDECAESQSDIPCFTESCINVHKSYFIEDMGEVYTNGKLAGDNSPDTEEFGSCTAVKFHN